MNNTDTTPAAELVEFTLIPADVELAPEEKHTLELSFTTFLDRFRTLRTQAENVQSPKIARAVRLELKALRVEAGKKHEALKAGVLRYGRAVDGAKNLIVGMIQPIEERLEEVEKAEERRLAAELAARDAERKALLAPYATAQFAAVSNLGLLPEEDFQTLLADSKAMYEARIRREEEEAARKLAAEVEAAKERERIRLENEQLLREAAEREAAAQVERERAAREKAELEAKLAQERQEAERQAKEAKAAAEAQAERLRAEAAKAAAAAAEVARKEREAAEALAAAERAKLEKAAAAERQAREELERQEAARLAAVEAERQRVADEQEKAAQAPDKQKLIAYAEAILAVAVPAMKSKKAQKIIAAFIGDLRENAESIKEAASKL